MRFTRPVDDRFHISAHFAEWGDRWNYVIDRGTGLWIPKAPETRGQHRGVDFDVPPGNVVSAIADGMVVRARFESAIRHDVGDGLNVLQIVIMPGHDAWWVKYSHLKAIYVEVGDKLRRGQPIAETGQSGAVEYPTLHVDLMNTRHQHHPISFS